MSSGRTCDERSNFTSDSLQVDDVILSRRGEQSTGTLHLTPHHLIFVHQIHPPAPDSASTTTAKSARPPETWITYPMIAFCTFRASPSASHKLSSIRLRGRDFVFSCFFFRNETKAREVYDTIKGWTCKLGRVEKLYAFSYQPPPPEQEVNSWRIYDPKKELMRLGVGEKGTNTNWRISNINIDYGVWIDYQRCRVFADVFSSPLRIRQLSRSPRQSQTIP